MWDNKGLIYGPGYPLTSFLMPLITLVTIDLILKGVALWKSSKSEQKGWFIALLIVNSLGILPLIYLLFFQKKTKKK